MKKIKTKLFALAFILGGAFSLEAQLAPSLNDAVDNGDGSYTNWFGTFSPLDGQLANEAWYSHAEHGYLYIWARGNNFWVYDENINALGEGLTGFAFTNPSLFPQFFIQGAGWYFYVPGVTGPEATPRIFINRKGDVILLPKATTNSIVDIAAGSDDFTSLVAAVVAADLVTTLDEGGPFTVFAPTNSAFAKLDPATVSDLLTNPESKGALTDILTYHVVPGRITSSMLGLDVISLLKGATLGGFVETVNGSDLRIDITPFGVMLDGTTMVTMPDVEAANGIIHFIDEVLMPPADIIDTAINAGIFNTLYAAIDAAGLESTLRETDGLTVFAPTDDAFAALGEETINALLADPTTLGNILAYHVFVGEAYSAAVAEGAIPMFNGDEAVISVTAEGTLMINDANIIITDIVASNGVIHVIDAVILPPTE
jgi:uncharacterized surface protein with fasciclin (FAS1) repeats